MAETNEFTALTETLNPIELPLDKIFLDPNNPRFVGPDWREVTQGQITDPGIQQVARGRLITEFGASKLADNMRVNGYLPIDRVVVQPISGSEGVYVVLEGNRRICAAKMIAESIAKDATSVSDSIARSLSSIPCLEYVGAEADASWIFQGLRHISGISEWSAFNKAKLLVEQMENEDLTLTQVAQRFGLTSFGAGQWVRGYYAFRQAKEQSDFIHELHGDAYPYFQELFGRSCIPMREWLEWDETTKSFSNVLNFNEFISWLYPRVNEAEQPDAFGRFEHRILRTRDDIRQLSYLIREDMDAFQQFRINKDVEQAYAIAMRKKYEREVRDDERTLFDVLSECERMLSNIQYRILRDDASRARLFDALKRIDDIKQKLTEDFKNHG